jgi:hypothetical protein
MKISEVGTQAVLLIDRDTNGFNEPELKIMMQ